MESDCPAIWIHAWESTLIFEVSNALLTSLEKPRARLIYTPAGTWIPCGNASKPRDLGRRLGKSSLFFLTRFFRGIGLTGDTDPCVAKHLNL
jgi:hypothetical protein